MKSIYTIITSVILTFFCITEAKSQIMDVNYFMRHTPMSYKMNPALAPTANIYVNFPALSGLNFGLNTSGFSYNDLINQHPTYADSLQLDLEGFSKKLSDNNYFKFSSSIDILGFGFRLGQKGYVSFGLDLNTDFRFNFSKGLVDFIIHGTDMPSDKAKIIDGRLVSLTSYIAPSISYTREINDKLTVGLRAKMPFGIANIKDNKSKVNLDFSNNQIGVMGDMQLYTSNIFGGLTMKGIDSTMELNTNDASKIISDASKNKGFAVDLGGSYKIREDMLLSLSVVDLGFINWKTNTISLESKNPGQQVTFNGLNVDYDEFDNVGDLLTDFADSIKNALDLHNKPIGSYTTMLPTKVYIGYSWNFMKGQTLNALYRGAIGNNYFDNQLSVFYSLQLGRYLNASIGNTFASKLFNPSAALNVNLYCLNFYFGGSFNSSYHLSKTSGASAYFGMNLAFGYKDYWKKKPKEDDNE